MLKISYNTDMNTYKVAIIEDVSDDCNLLKSFLDKYQKENDVSFNIEAFTTAESFLYPKVESFDILFIDIELPGINGLELAKKVRDTNKNVVIIFVTTLRKYVINGYEVDAINYILKPYDYGSIKYTLDKAIKNVESHADSTFIMKIDGAIKVFNTNDIYFFEIMKHDLLISTTYGDFITYGNLTTVENSLNSKSFFRISSSIIINLRYVSQIKGNTVRVNNHDLVIGRTKKKDFIKAFLEYHG